ncbi:MAG TPA: hypothetical protein VF215_11845, partial [Thermoanaerobaculia bacterium]
AATGFFANFAARLGLRAQAVDRDRSLGQGLNGLTTISRLGNNTILARLGASTANNQYEMVARTYNVTVLALVPTFKSIEESDETYANTSDDQRRVIERVRQNTSPCSTFSYTAYSTFRDALRGKALPSQFKSRREQLIDSTIDAWEFGDPRASTAIKKLLFYTEMGDDEKFATEARRYASAELLSPIATLSDPATRNIFWHDMVRLDQVSGRSHGKFQLPEPTENFFADQNITLFDDGKTTTATVNGARNVTSDGLHAQVEARSATDQVFLNESDAKISEDRHRATFTFPSIKAKLGGAPVLGGVQFVARKTQSGSRGATAVTDEMRGLVTTYRLVEEVRTPQPTKMTITSDKVRLASAGTCEVAVAFSSDKSIVVPSVVILVSGGTIASVTPGGSFMSGGVEVPAQGSYVLSLKNVFADTPVIIKAVLAADPTNVIGEKTLTASP